MSVYRTIGPLVVTSALRLKNCKFLSFCPIFMIFLSNFQSCENRRSVGQNRHFSEMSGEFCQFAGQCVRQKIITQKIAQTVFWVTWSSMDENCICFLCILTVFLQRARFINWLFWPFILPKSQKPLAVLPVIFSFIRTHICFRYVKHLAQKY